MKKTGCFFLGLFLGFGMVVLGILAAYYGANQVAPYIMGAGLLMAYVCFIVGRQDNEHRGRKGD